MSEVISTRKRFQEVSFLEAAMFGFITAQKYYDDNPKSYKESIALFCDHFNIEKCDIDLDSAKVAYFRTQSKVKSIISNRKMATPFPSQITEVMKELNFMISENAIMINSISERCEFITEMINKIDTNGRR